MNITEIVANAILEEIMLYGVASKNNETILKKKGSSYYGELSSNTIITGAESNYEGCADYKVYELVKDFYIKVKKREPGDLLNKYILFHPSYTDMITFDEVGGSRKEYSGVKQEINTLRLELIDKKIMKETHLEPAHLQLLLFAWMWINDYTTKGRRYAIEKYLEGKERSWKKTPSEWQEIESKFIYRGMVIDRNIFDELLAGEIFDVKRDYSSWSTSEEYALNFITNYKTAQKYKDGSNKVCVVLRIPAPSKGYLLNLNKMYHLMRSHNAESEKEVILSWPGIRELTSKDICNIW